MRRVKALIARAMPRQIWAVIAPLWYRIRRIEERHAGDEFGARSEAFSQIYRENRFGDSESRSGRGSTLAYTAPLRKALPRLVRRLGVNSLLDAPCGDFNWMRMVQFPAGFRYLGRDIVPELMADIAQKYARPDRDFATMDIVTDATPAADIWLCRDVLFHLPNADAIHVLQNFARSQIRYLLTTTYDFVHANRDVKPGGFRFLNLRIAPFDLPAPLTRIADFIVPEPPRYLALWSLAQIRATALGSATLAAHGVAAA